MECMSIEVLDNGDALVDLYDPETGETVTDRIQGYMWPLGHDPRQAEAATPPLEPYSDDDEYPF